MVRAPDPDAVDARIPTEQLPRSAITVIFTLVAIFKNYYDNFIDILSSFYSAAALLAMQRAVLATAIPSVCLSVCLPHAGTLSRRMNVGSRGFHCEVAKTLSLTLGSNLYNI